MSATTVAFFAGVIVGSFLSMFTLALFIAGSEGASEQDPPARPHLDERAPDIIPILTAPSERRGVHPPAGSVGAR